MLKFPSFNDHECQIEFIISGACEAFHNHLAMGKGQMHAILFQTKTHTVHIVQIEYAYTESYTGKK